MNQPAVTSRVRRRFWLRRRLRAASTGPGPPVGEFVLWSRPSPRRLVSASAVRCRGRVRTGRDDLLLAFVQPIQESWTTRVDVIAGPFLPRKDRVDRLGGPRTALRSSSGNDPMLELAGDRPSEVLHDRPRSVSAELVAARVIKLLHRADQRHVAVADQGEEVIGAGNVTFGDRNDQPQVALHDLVLDAAPRLRTARRSDP